MGDHHHHHHQLSSTRSGIRNAATTELPKHKLDKRVAVVYYLSRNGTLQHPHFIEVPLSSPDNGLYLRDVINRLDSLRGKGMAGLYSWSCKRSYKSGFVWHDLSENDFIYPVNGQEYFLKGSELYFVDSASALISKSDETVTSRTENQSPECKVSGEDSDFPIVRRPRNQSLSSIDLHDEYKVYKAESTSSKSVCRTAAANASTQTDDKRRQRITELSRDEISPPPPSDSRPETLDTINNGESRNLLVQRSEQIVIEKSTAGNDQQPLPGRVKASAVLMQLITCGSVSFSDCGPSAYGENLPGFSLISHYNERLPRGEGQNRVKKDAGEAKVGGSRSFNFRGIGRNKVKVLEDKEYFSGSLIETNKDEFPVLKRSSSYNVDR